MPNGVRRFTQRLHRRVRVLSVYRHVTRSTQMPTQKRIAKELLLCSKAKLKRQRCKDYGNVHVTLMIDAKNVRSSGFDVLSPVNTNPHARSPQNHARPCSRTCMLNPAAGVDN